jgi:hypothetical protein
VLFLKTYGNHGVSDIWAGSTPSAQGPNGAESLEFAPVPPAGHQSNEKLQDQQPAEQEITLSPSSLVPSQSATVAAVAEVTKAAIASVPEAQCPLTVPK